MKDLNIFWPAERLSASWACIPVMGLFPFSVWEAQRKDHRAVTVGMARLYANQQWRSRHTAVCVSGLARHASERAGLWFIVGPPLSYIRKTGSGGKNWKLQTRLLIREGVPHQQTRNCPKIIQEIRRKIGQLTVGRNITFTLTVFQ
jgi:hypothetical protein